MRLVTYERDGERRIGVQVGERVVDLRTAYAATLERTGEARAREIAERAIPSDMVAFLSNGTESMTAAQRAVEDAQAGRVPSAAIVPLGDLRLLAPIPRPGKVLGVGRNYPAHAAEAGGPRQEEPRMFAKLSSAVVGPGAIIPKPARVTKLDYEVELAVVIGKRCKSVSESAANEYIAGYTICNDVSAREFQLDVSPPQTTFGKSMDGFCPLGPCLATPDELPDPPHVMVRCWVNDQLVQEANSRELIYSIPYTIAYVSQYMTLEPGDIITTGTPPGVGVFRNPPLFLQPGDRVRLEIPEIGVLENTIG